MTGTQRKTALPIQCLQCHEEEDAQLPEGWLFDEIGNLYCTNCRPSMAVCKENAKARLRRILFVEKREQTATVFDHYIYADDRLHDLIVKLAQKQLGRDRNACGDDEFYDAFNAASLKVVDELIDELANTEKEVQRVVQV